MPKYHIVADTDTGEFSFLKDNLPVPHDNMSCGCYSCGSYDNNGTYKENTKKRAHISHTHNNNGTQESHDVAFYLGEAPDPNNSMSPSYNIPQSVGKLVDQAIAAKKLETLFSIKKVN